MLDLRRLQLLREFAVQGTIARAADALGYTASAVSQQLSALEREVGAQLLDRTARSAELTETGRLLVEQAEQILAMVEATEAVLAEQRGAVTGPVTVAAVPTTAVAFAPRLAESLRRYRQMQLILRQTAESAGVRQVAAADADIALIDDWTGRSPSGGSATIRHEHLLRDPLVLAVPANHRLADPERPVRLDRLLHESWIAAPRGEPSRTGTDALLADVGGAPSAAWEFEGLGTILSLVSRGIGIAAVPALALAGGVGGLAFRRLPADAPSRDVYAAVRAASVRRPAIAVTLRALRSAAEDVQRDVAAILDSAAS
ncbi:LysR family transcriptional regulator [Nocardiopsis coralliicola]